MPHCILLAARVDSEDYPIDQCLPKDGEMHVLTMQIMGEVPGMVMAFRGQVDGPEEFTPLDALRQWCENGHPPPPPGMAESLMGRAMEPHRHSDAGAKYREAKTVGEYEDKLTVPWNDIDKSAMEGTEWFLDMVIYQFAFPNNDKAHEFLKHMWETYHIGHPDKHGEMEFRERLNVAVGAQLGRDTAVETLGKTALMYELWEHKGPGYMVRASEWRQAASIFDGIYYGWQIRGYNENPPQSVWGVAPTGPSSRRTKRQPKRRRR